MSSYTDFQIGNSLKVIIALPLFLLTFFRHQIQRMVKINTRVVTTQAIDMPTIEPTDNLDSPVSGLKSKWKKTISVMN